MPNRIHDFNYDLLKLTVECKAGQINTLVVDNQIPVLLEKMHKLTTQMHQADLHMKAAQAYIISRKMLEISAILLFVAEQRLAEMLRDKEKYAPHPTFIPD